ncbi:hypothetical protein F0562_004761 [Nyssa sinensis]|uniref:DEUBAD domain-containing protein n=1 Tax=Nyssa sinensis TaxID=561372 RepID=A0A5J5AJU1_9ASTE|nr:hypothetical protein F0562_004761 [Nyssa sinensis]
MAADQRKKRLSATGIASSWEQCRVKRKKKNLGLPQYGFNMRSSISLEWDDKKKSVLAKREQIGLPWRDLVPFVDYVPHCDNILADVFSVPQEIFDVESLTKVLSYQVWQTHLSERERNLLTQFLPKGADAHQIVRELLAGDDFHFGNPFLKWGASLCFGNLHPDAVLHQEQCFKANKKAYYSELQKYHRDMIGNLQMWKERWASCKDPKKEIVQKMWRSRKHAEKNIPNHANESKFCDLEENLTATSESCSWAADEKAYSSDNQNLMKHGELQTRKGFMEVKCDNSSDGLKVVARPRRGEKPHKRNIQRGDGAKYMSYIKVSKEQHQRVKSSMKHSSNSIQSRSLNRVLGNLDTFHVQPFEVFEEEERKKVHEHWLKLANRVLPAAFSNWRRRQLQKWQLTESLKQEMEEKLKSLKQDEENENTHSMLPEQMDNGVPDHEASNTIEDGEKEKSDSLLQEQMENGAANHEPAITLRGEERENQNPEGILREQIDNGAANPEPNIEGDNKSVPDSTESQHLQQIPPLSGSHEFHHMDLDSDNKHAIAKTDDAPPNVSEYPENLGCVEIAVSQGDPLSSVSDVWPVVSMPDPYYNSTLNHKYASARAAASVTPIGAEAEEIERSLYAVKAFRRTCILMEVDALFPDKNISSPANIQDWDVNASHMSVPLQSHLNGGGLLSQNWYSGEHRAHDSWSGLDVAVGSNRGVGNRNSADESLFSVVSQCNELRSSAPYDSMGSTEQFIQSGNYGGVGGVVPTPSNVLPHDSAST